MQAPAGNGLWLCIVGANLRVKLDSGYQIRARNSSYRPGLGGRTTTLAFLVLNAVAAVLPQLVVSLAVSRAEDKSIIFLISAVVLALSAVAWLLVSDDDGHSQ